MYVKNIYSHVSFVFMGNTTRLHTASDSDNVASDSVSDNGADNNTDSEQNENTFSSDSQEERTVEKESESTKEENISETTEVEEIQATDNSEMSSETIVSTLSDSDADIITLLQENNELLQKQYTVTASYLNLLTFTLLAIWVINSIHKSVTRMSRRKEK